jgi:hypothetical protein
MFSAIASTHRCHEDIATDASVYMHTVTAHTLLLYHCTTRTHTRTHNTAAGSSGVALGDSI